MSIFASRVERHLIADEGEVIVDEVVKHWMAGVRPILELVLAVALLIASIWVWSTPWPWLSWLPWIAAGLLVVHGVWRLLDVRLDRFVITNLRVFRVNGILTRRIATMPISRILDISVRKPLGGRIFGYGHFVFESAAQDQGLKEIRYVGDPDERGLTIQRVIQRSGLRGSVPRPPGDPQAPWTGPAAGAGLDAGRAPRRPRWPATAVDERTPTTEPIELNGWPFRQG
ncbi:PH domain-containing protein [Agromyces archimandritae]|uniref:PH domain-containing protein n=1 Tax=Agromyces archimandritae TaxID=2781962 RepID=A0A975FJH2_9MICO|nr:PH domain-containing protein [Agromyces archimandritae]QTX03645.1 PH domain-containing protein [Agromyces archimandritae]